MAAKNTIYKRIEDLTIGDEYLFESVMQNEKLCKLFIEKFLEIPEIEKIKSVSAEESYKPTFHGRGVRFDIYVKGQDDVAYVVELQRKDTKELEKRFRYYQSMIDSKQLAQGKNYSYKNLKDSYIIFICRDDFLDQGHYRYTFRTSCVEIPELVIYDGSHKVIFNTKGTQGEISDDVKSFLRAIEGIESDNEFVKLFQDEAEEIKENETWRESYMQSLLREMDRYDEAYENGLEDGRAAGHAAGQEIGANSKAVEVAKSLLSSGMPVSEVMMHSKLPLEQVELLLLDSHN